MEGRSIERARILSPNTPDSVSPSAAAPAETALQYEVSQLYGDHAPALYGYARTECRSADIAQDAVQEAFFRYYVYRSSGGRVQNQKAWLFRVARNYILDRRKQSFSRSELGIEDIRNTADDTVANPEEQYETVEATRKIPEVLAKRELECLELRAAGFRYEEIASMLNIRCGTVGATLARVARKLKQFGRGGD